MLVFTETEPEQVSGRSGMSGPGEIVKYYNQRFLLTLSTENSGWDSEAGPHSIIKQTSAFMAREITPRCL